MSLSDRVYRLNLGVPEDFEDMSAYSAYLGNGVVSLEKRVAALEAENERLKETEKSLWDQLNDLSASYNEDQGLITQLRAALELCQKRIDHEAQGHAECRSDLEAANVLTNQLYDALKDRTDEVNKLDAFRYQLTEQVRVLMDRIEQARKALNEECYQKLAELLADDEAQQALAEVKYQQPEN